MLVSVSKGVLARKSTVSKAGIQVGWWFPARWIPAFAGMTS